MALENRVDKVPGLNIGFAHLAMLYSAMWGVMDHYVRPEVAFREEIMAFDEAQSLCAIETHYANVSQDNTISQSIKERVDEDRRRFKEYAKLGKRLLDSQQRDAQRDMLRRMYNFSEYLRAESRNYSDAISM